ncbi:MAG: hypothetical protein R6V01_03700, partial [Thermoplasmatota archaeon]
MKSKPDLISFLLVLFKAVFLVFPSMELRPEGRGDLSTLVDVIENLKASMGPRPEGRGNVDLAGGGGRLSQSFNGATSRRTWKSVQTRPRFDLHCQGFNGATSRRTWKYEEEIALH